MAENNNPDIPEDNVLNAVHDKITDTQDELEDIQGALDELETDLKDTIKNSKDITTYSQLVNFYSSFKNKLLVNEMDHKEIQTITSKIKKRVIDVIYEITCKHLSKELHESIMSSSTPEESQARFKTLLEDDSANTALGTLKEISQENGIKLDDEDQKKVQNIIEKEFKSTESSIQNKSNQLNNAHSQLEQTRSYLPKLNNKQLTSISKTIANIDITKPFDNICKAIANIKQYALYAMYKIKNQVQSVRDIITKSKDDNSPTLPSHSLRGHYR